MHKPKIISVQETRFPQLPTDTFDVPDEYLKTNCMALYLIKYFDKRVLISTVNNNEDVEGMFRKESNRIWKAITDQKSFSTLPKRQQKAAKDSSKEIFFNKICVLLESARGLSDYHQQQYNHGFNLAWPSDVVTYHTVKNRLLSLYKQWKGSQQSTVYNINNNTSGHKKHEDTELCKYLSANENAMTQMDTNGNNVFHYACWFPNTLDPIHILYKHLNNNNQKLRNTANRFGFNPLDYAHQNPKWKNTPNTNILQTNDHFVVAGTPKPTELGFDDFDKLHIKF